LLAEGVMLGWLGFGAGAVYGVTSHPMGLPSHGSGVSSIQPVAVSARVRMLMSHFMICLRCW